VIVNSDFIVFLSFPICRASIARPAVLWNKTASPQAIIYYFPPENQQIAMLFVDGRGAPRSESKSVACRGQAHLF